MKQLDSKAIALIFTTLLIAGCSLGKQQPQKPVMIDGPTIISLDPSVIAANKIKTIKVRLKTLKIPLVTTAVVKLNDDAVFKISSMISGRVVKDSLKLGDIVKEGTILTYIENPEIAKIQTNYIHELHQNEIDIMQAQTRLDLANDTLAREKKLVEEGISPRKDYIQAEANMTLADSDLKAQKHHKEHLISEAKVYLGTYGLNVSNLNPSYISTRIPIIAPASGIVIKKNISSGAIIATDTILYEIADLSVLWLDLNIYSDDLDKIKPGQTVEFQTNSYPDKQFKGQVNYIQPNSISNVATFTARVFINNENLLLKPGMLGKAIIEQNQTETKIFVPNDCIQKYGKEYFVFEALDKNRFEKKTISLGGDVPGGHLINSGIDNGAILVSNGSFLLKAELLKGLFEDE